MFAVIEILLILSLMCCCIIYLSFSCIYYLWSNEQLPHFR